jgi:hypothetical protein
MLAFAGGALSQGIEPHPQPSPSSGGALRGRAR